MMMTMNNNNEAKVLSKCFGKGFWIKSSSLGGNEKLWALVLI